MDKQTILCVDDEVNVLHSLTRLLRKEGYVIMTADSGSEALSILAQQRVQVVISDQRMPGMTGTELLQKVKEQCPETVRVVLSGYADVGVILEAINQGEIYRFLTKPWNDEELKVAIRQCFLHYDLLQENRALIEQIHSQNEELRTLNGQLSDLLTERSHSLSLSQEILEKLPIPILGVSQEGMVAIINEAVRKHFPSFQSIILGSDVTEALPKPLSDIATACLQGKSPLKSHPLQIDEKWISIETEPLQQWQENLRGCILVFKEVER